MTTRQQKDLDLDTWLETGLRTGLEPLLTPTVPLARYALLIAPAPRRGARGRLLAGSASAVMLMGGSAVAVVAASTGTLDTAVWGRHISAAVKTCRGELSSGESGIGQCVSAIASRKGDEEAHPGVDSSNRPAKSAPPGAGVSAPETPPGHGGTRPGQGGTPRGLGGTPPGQGGTPPGQGGTPPGHATTPPGQGGNPPGHGGPPRGHSPKN